MSTSSKTTATAAVAPDVPRPLPAVAVTSDAAAIRHSAQLAGVPILRELEHATGSLSPGEGAEYSWTHQERGVVVLAHNHAGIVRWAAIEHELSGNLDAANRAMQTLRLAVSNPDAVEANAAIRTLGAEGWDA